MIDDNYDDDEFVTSFNLPDDDSPEQADNSGLDFQNQPI